MLSFFTKKVIDTTPLLRRIVDVTMPNKPVYNDTRMERRFNRTLPLVITPSNNGVPDVKNSLMALTQDFSDRGMASVSLEALNEGEYFVSVWPQHEDFEKEPIHFRCKLCNCRPLAHGFWATGFSIEEVMNVEHRRAMAKLTKVAMNALRIPESGGDDE